MNHEAILNAYWPVIEKCIEVQKHYKNRICPDITGEMITELNKARAKYPIVREVV